jgi:hypothetical protein
MTLRDASCTKSTAALVAAAALAAGAAGCGSGDDNDSNPPPRATASPAPATGAREQLSGGETTLRLDATTKRVLDVAGIDISPIGDATRANGRYVFPISGGTLATSPLSGTIQHSGGLRFSAAGHSIDARKLTVDPTSGVVTAEVEGRRVPLLSLDVGDLDRVPPRGGAQMVIPATASLLGGSALSQIGDRLGVSALAKGLELGHLVVSAKA